jgi:hypothetical protein
VNDVLHVFFDGVYWVAATSTDDANSIVSEHEDDEYVPLQPWRQLPDDQELTESLRDDHDCIKIHRKCGKWASEAGRGILGSTEY